MAKPITIPIQFRIKATVLATITQHINEHANKDKKLPHIIIKKSTCLKYVLEQAAKKMWVAGHEFNSNDNAALEVLGDLYFNDGSGGADVMDRLKGAIAGDVDSGKGGGV